MISAWALVIIKPCSATPRHYIQHAASAGQLKFLAEVERHTLQAELPPAIKNCDCANVGPLL